MQKKKYPAQYNEVDVSLETDDAVILLKIDEENSSLKTTKSMSHSRWL